MSIQWIDLSGLGGLDQLGDGGEGVVYRITQPVGYVYKEYKPVVAAEVFPKGLEVTAELLHQLGDKQSFIGERSAWPEVLVRKNGAFSGFLMKKIPDDFSCRHGMKGRARQGLTDWNKLVTRDDWMDKDNIESSVPKFNVLLKKDEKVLLQILLDLAKLFECLHNHGIVVGDVSGRNLLWAIKPSPTVFLIDCDGFRREGERAVTTSKQSPDWLDPQLNGGTTLDSDRFKLATAMYRAYFADPFGAPSNPNGVVTANSEKILELATRGVAPSNRTTAKEWREALEGMIDGSRTWVRPQRRQPSPDSTESNNPVKKFRPWQRK